MPWRNNRHRDAEVLEEIIQEGGEEEGDEDIQEARIEISNTTFKDEAGVKDSIPTSRVAAAAVDHSREGEAGGLMISVEGVVGDGGVFK